MNFVDRREFKNRATEHVHAPNRVGDAPKIDENEVSEVVGFIDKYVTLALPDKTKYPEISSLVKKVKTHHHATNCRKKTSITCTFNTPWAPSYET